MKKRIFSLLLLCGTLLKAEVINMEVNAQFVEENATKIIDIRTEKEWRELGVIPKAHLITFFSKDNKFSGELFIQELNRVVEKGEQFAIISNSSSRSKLVSNFLSKKHDYRVINLLGGISKLLKEGYKIEKYNACRLKEEVTTQKTEKKETTREEIKREEAKREEAKKEKTKQEKPQKESEVKEEENNATKA